MNPLRNSDPFYGHLVRLQNFFIAGESSCRVREKAVEDSASSARPAYSRPVQRVAAARRATHRLSSAALLPVPQLPACRRNCPSRRSRCRRRRSRTSTAWPAARAAKISSLWSTNVRRAPTTARATSAETDSFPTSISTRPVFQPALPVQMPPTSPWPPSTRSVSVTKPALTLRCGSRNSGPRSQTLVPCSSFSGLPPLAIPTSVH
jgi:hypothetical protein